MKKISAILSKIKNEKKIFIIVGVGLIGILLIALSELLPATENKSEKNKEEQTTYTVAATYEQGVEQRLEEIISKIEGTGNVSVMVTISSSPETVYAKNEKEKTKTDEKSSEYSYDGSYVTDSKDGGVVLKTSEPKIRGVIVVCDGGDKAAVKKDVTDAVSSVLSINSNNISVLKMKIQEEQK